MSKYRGHNIEFISNKWVYSDTKELVSNNRNRECGYCGKVQTKDGHDGCLGELSGVMNACCGHGCQGDAYIQYKNGKIINGEKAVDIQNKLKIGEKMELLVNIWALAKDETSNELKTSIVITEDNLKAIISEWYKQNNVVSQDFDYKVELMTENKADDNFIVSKKILQDMLKDDHLQGVAQRFYSAYEELSTYLSQKINQH